MKAAFEGAASELQGSEVKFAVVDVTKEKDLAKELNATSSAGIRLYLAGDKYNPVPCPGTYWCVSQSQSRKGFPRRPVIIGDLIKWF